MKERKFRIVGYAPKPQYGFRTPIGALTIDRDGVTRFVRSEFLPDAHGLGGRAHQGMIHSIIKELETIDDFAITNHLLGPHIVIDPEKSVPHGVESAHEWLLKYILPSLTRQRPSAQG